MTSPATRFLTTLPGTIAAVGTGLIALISWSGFTTDPAEFLAPLVILGLVIAGSGLIARTLGLPWGLTLVGQAGLSTWVAYGLIDAEDGVRQAIADAVQSANQFAPPIPASAPPIDPLLIVSGLGCLIALDLLACSLRTPALAGLPLLAIYTIPVSITGAGIPWWVFVCTALGFVALLFIQERQRLAQWSRGADDPQGIAGQTLQVHGNNGPIAAASIAVVATVAALVIPLAVPTMGMNVFADGFGTGGEGGDIRIENPMTDLRRDLDPNRPDVPLMTVVTEDPSPNYLRVSVLSQLSGTTFTPGDRRIPQDQTAQGSMPEPMGVAGSVQRRAFKYDVAIEENFESIWLPTALDISAINAEGDWRYDTRTRDFLRVGTGLTTAGMTYDFTKTEFAISGSALSNSQSATGSVDPIFTGIPTDLPARVRQLAQEVTAGATSDYQRAVALQNWFRDTDNFTYDLTPTGSGDLLSFLSPQGRRGYCEQFATAMTVMARTLGIPARVGVGFLNPERTGPNTYEFSSRDMHAWPELYFPGSGWVRFEPTPAARDGAVAPGYTDTEIPDVAVPEPTAPTAQPSDDLPSRGAEAEPEPQAEDQAAEPEVDTTDTDAGLPIVRVLSILSLLAALILILCLPRLARQARRKRRLRHLSPNQAWLELRDSALDLGFGWREGISPRATGAWLSRFIGATLGATPTSQPQGDPDPLAALSRLVAALEEDRYSRPGAPGNAGQAEALRRDIAICVQVMTSRASRTSRLCAHWLPRSLLRSRGPAAQSSPQRGEQSESTQSRVVDRVG